MACFLIRSIKKAKKGGRKKEIEREVSVAGSQSRIKPKTEGEKHYSFQNWGRIDVEEHRPARSS